MKRKIILICLVLILLSTSVLAVVRERWNPPLSKFAHDALAAPSTLKVDTTIILSGQPIKLINTGTENDKGYAIFDVNGITEKIYEKESAKIGDIEIYVDSVSDEQGSKYDTAVVYLAARNQKLIGSRAGEAYFELMEGDTVNLRTGEKVTLADVRRDTILVDVDGVQVTIYVGQGKQVGYLNINVKNIYYNALTEGGRAIITFSKDEPPKEETKPKVENLKEKTFACATGCLYQNSCVAVGFFTNDIFCSGRKLIELRKELGAECYGNYECKSELCQNNVCLKPEVVATEVEFNDVEKEKLRNVIIDRLTRLKEFLLKLFGR